MMIEIVLPANSYYTQCTTKLINGYNVNRHGGGGHIIIIIILYSDDDDYHFCPRQQFWTFVFVFITFILWEDSR